MLFRSIEAYRGQSKVEAAFRVYTWVPSWLQERIRARVAKHGHCIFGSHTTKSLDVITEGWRRKLNRIWEMSGPWKETPTPHRFRHTFARMAPVKTDFSPLRPGTVQLCSYHSQRLPRESCLSSLNAGRAGNEN